MAKSPAMTVRPYQLLCAVCALGGGDSCPAARRTKKLLDAVQENPDRPITLRCRAGDVFAYQDPGAADDTPEGAEFNLRRDLEILHKLDLVPGYTLPARILFYRVLDTFESVAGICGYPSVTSEHWKGCPGANSGDYEKGRARGIGAIIPPRDENELKKEKADSLAAMYAAKAIRTRPHILLCSICQYGGGTRPPYPEDNLPELLALVLQKPDVLLEMAPSADWMMCAPCPYRAPDCNGCVNNKGSGGLPNQMRDLRVLQKLGLAYGSIVKARDVYKLIFERMPGTLETCRTDHTQSSIWWSGCGAATVDSANYAKGRTLLMAAMGL